MAGLSHLQTLLASMKPILNEGEYVFTVVSDAQRQQLKPVLVFVESEGTTVIVSRQEADLSELSYEAVWAFITLSVHSDLQAVGFLAAITAKLADAGISVNAVSAYYHDHLFVPAEKAAKVMEILISLSHARTS